jgi:hypothetical protein
MHAVGVIVPATRPVDEDRSPSTAHERVRPVSVVGEPDVEGIDADALYALDPAEFVAARNDLVRRLRAAGRRDEAAVVAKRRRPSPVAWALDFVARHDPELLERALAASVRLRDATEAAVTGDATELRLAMAEDRAANDAVVELAVRRLGNRGPAARPQLAATLQAAALDDEVGAELRRGVLASDHEAPAFGWPGFEGLEAGPATPATKRSAPSGLPRGQRREIERGERGRAEGRAQERRRRARREADAARLEQRALRLIEAAERAEATARRARAEADAAAEQARVARGALDQD